MCIRCRAADEDLENQHGRDAWKSQDHLPLPENHRSAKLAVIRGLLKVPEPVRNPEPVDYRERYARLFGHSIDICPACGGHLVEIAVLKPVARPFRCDCS
jgi:hypothetical protein